MFELQCFFVVNNFHLIVISFLVSNLALTIWFWLLALMLIVNYIQIIQINVCICARLWIVGEIYSYILSWSKEISISISIFITVLICILILAIFVITIYFGYLCIFYFIFAVGFIVLTLQLSDIIKVLFRFLLSHFCKMTNILGIVILILIISELFFKVLLVDNLFKFDMALGGEITNS